MASVLWVTVFALLCLELAVTFLLCFRSTGRAICSAVMRNPLTKQIKTVIQFIAFGLAIGLYDSVSTLTYLNAKEVQGPRPPTDPTITSGIIQYSIDRPRKFRAERNMYLTAFCLVLLFVIRGLFILNRALLLAEQQLATKLASRATETAANQNRQPSASTNAASPLAASIAVPAEGANETQSLVSTPPPEIELNVIQPAAPQLSAQEKKEQ
eukprot:CAMPEP_0185833802 /NCGR_PEP_ID=MMETSP1353-20130828/3502_1 /TAXON_ID=1077150 /ORGANISM="Erythrolobus australicus, Strain CCMP3124" /LENGTH=211 /DNA_ID=CAMNT_0028532131 /DNA_START=51 /DNA_END=686 /DNA_ORIENTATION=+